MSEKIVTTETELKEALELKAEKIILQGSLANKIIAKKKSAKTKKTAGVTIGIGGLALIVGGLILAPFTGGATAAGAFAGAAALAATIGGTTLTTAEFAMLLGAGTLVAGGALGLAGDTLKHYDIKIAANETEVILTRKN